MSFAVKLHEERYHVYEEGSRFISLGDHDDEEDATAQIVGMEAAMKSIKALDEQYALEVLGAPFGGHLPGNRDGHGEYFTKDTNFMIDQGDARPVTYYHGQTPDGDMELAVATVGKAWMIRKDVLGVWFRVVRDTANKYASRLWQAAKQGKLYGSTGTISYLNRATRAGKITQWPIGELALMDIGTKRQPANMLAVGHITKAFEEAGLEIPEVLTEDPSRSRIISGMSWIPLLKTTPMSPTSRCVRFDI